MKNHDVHIDMETFELAQRTFQLAREGDAASLKRMLALGLPANLMNGKGDSLLMLASYYGHVEAARVLLEHGADPAQRNDQGQTPLAGAAFKGDVEITRLLLKHGAHVNGRCRDGKTALMFAAMFDRADVIDVLIAHGARPDLADHAGMKAADYAQAMGAKTAAGKLDFPPLALAG